MQFIFGFLGSLLGGVVFGPINLSAIDITLKKSIRSGLSFSVAAALAEMALATIAILFGKLISRRIEEFPELKLLVIVFFLILGFYFLFKRDKPEADINTDRKKSNFFNGFVLGVLNPQAIPSWIFILAYLKSAQVLYLKSWYLWFFIAGVFIGKFIILSFYCYLSEYINKHIANLNDFVSKAIGGILLVVGFVQAVKYFFF